MNLELHTIKPAHGSKKKTKRVGRGNASGKGTSAARGTKGQKARSGGKSGNLRRGFKKALQKIHKNRGFRSLERDNQVINLVELNKLALKTDKITPLVLKENGLIANAENPVKILASGEISKAITVSGCLVSKKAEEMIKSIGGKVEK